MRLGPLRRRAWLPLILAAGVLLGHGVWIQAKAVLAQHLLQRAWDRTLADGEIHRPWPWADHWPVARIRSARHGVDWIVLEGDSGHVLAFAPGHHPRSALPGEGDVLVISGHRDTHFRFLKRVRLGDTIEVETPEGRFAYEVDDFRVVSASKARIRTGETGELLMLVTCYPFDSPIAGARMRYVVTAAPSLGAAL
ncbi:MAG: class GN sortase [Gammaproteobacteria bacterium]|nr:class GN sortase [Gammaproteobacteria bacterium]